MRPNQAITAADIIAIVDDDEAVRDSLQLLLETEGYRVRQYSSAVSFLSDPRSADVDCWVCDLHMPAMDGAEMIECARKLGWKTSAIVVTAKIDINLQRRLKQIDVLEIFEKPVADTLLLEAIGKACVFSKSG